MTTARRDHRGNKRIDEEASLQLVEIEILEDRRRQDDVARLSRELNGACTAAVTAHQVAALLEAEGLNDRIVKQRYGRDGVFALAEELYDEVPLRRDPEPVEPPPVVSEIAEVPAAALVMRGPMYLVPLLFFMAASTVFEGAAMLTAGLLALFLGWSWNQGTGALVYRLIGRGDVPGAKAMALGGLAVGVPLITLLVASVSWGVFGDVVEPALFAAGQTMYLLGAAVLLTFGLDRYLYLAVTPGVFMVLTYAFLDRIPAWVPVAGAVTVPVFIVLLVLVGTQGRRWRSLKTLRKTDIRIAVGLGTLGLLWAVLIGLAALSILDTGNVVATVSIAAAGMVLTMGIAEWQILSYRRWVSNLLIHTGDINRFARSARRSYVRMNQLTFLIVTATSAFIATVAYGLGWVETAGLILTIGFVFLGLAFISGLLLVTAGRLSIPIVWSAFVALELAAVLVIFTPDATASAVLYAGACLVLFVGLFSCAVNRVGKPVAHR